MGFRENKMDAVAKKFKKEAKVDEENIENAPNLQKLWDEFQKKRSPEDSGNESDSESNADTPPLRVKKSPLAKSTPARKKKNAPSSSDDSSDDEAKKKLKSNGKTTLKVNATVNAP